MYGVLLSGCDEEVLFIVEKKLGNSLGTLLRS
mgnify:CR=1 FL=1